MKQVYVVSCRTGEYEDARSSTLFVCGTEKQAKDFCAKGNKWLKKHDLNYGNPKARNLYLVRNDLAAVKPKFDPAFDFDYTGADYTYDAVEWRDE